MFASSPLFLIWFFGVKSSEGKSLITKICQKTDNYFTKLSIDKIITWDNTFVPENLIRIHGEKDMLLPIPKGKEFLSLGKEGHFAIVENYDLVTQYVNEILLSLN